MARFNSQKLAVALKVYDIPVLKVIPGDSQVDDEIVLSDSVSVQVHPQGLYACLTKTEGEGDDFGVTSGRDCVSIQDVVSEASKFLAMK